MKFYSYSIIVLRLLYLIAGAYFLIFSSWYYAVIGYIFISICNGVAAHRYFVHDQFKVNYIGKIFLAFLATIGMYSPLSYWIIQHKHHHRNSDKSQDIHSPKNSIVNSMLTWPFKLKLINSVYKDRSSLVLSQKIKEDLIVSMFSKYFIFINISFILILSYISFELCKIYLIGVVLDYIKIGLINFLCHTKIIGNYRNYNTNDNSHNSLLLGLITLGFGWHNNHHNNPNKLILKEKWWETDIEGIVGLILSKIFKP